MTNKLNSLANNYLSLTTIAPKIGRSLLGMGLIIIATAIPARAKDEEFITELLPPPPPLSSPNRVIKQKRDVIVPVDLDPPTYTSKQQQREYTFSAPPQDNRDYRVEVFGSQAELLEQVRAIEPKAFQKGDVIQVGIFSRQDNAEDLVRKLAVKGFWARIIVSESY